MKRFYSEARSAGNLRHPNIVTIYELGHEGETPFIAMQFLSGESLDKIIDRMPSLPLSQRLGIVVYVCRALDYAHRQNPPVNLNSVYTRPGYAGVWGVSGVGNLFAPGTLTGSVPVYNATAPGESGYAIRNKQFSPSVGLAWQVPAAGGPMITYQGSA